MSSASSPQGQGPASAAASTTNNKRGRAPASNEAILGLRQITAADYDFPSGECAICLQDFGAAEEKDTLQLRALPCSHAFHHHCISQWLRCNAVCPLCRHQLPTEEDDYVDENMWFARRRRVTELELSLAHPADFNGYVSTEPFIITEQVQEHQIHEQIDFEELNRILNDVYNEFLQLRSRHQT